MKKSTVLHTIILVLGISLAAHASGAQKVTFGPGSDWDVSSSGFVVINKTPTGAIEATIQIQIRNAASECVYEVWSGGSCLDTFTTNKKGHGHVHINLSSEGDLAAISIWTEDKISEILRASTPEDPGKKKKKQEEIEEEEEEEEEDPGKKKKKKQEEIEEEEEEY